MKDARQTQLLHQQQRKITMFSVSELTGEKSSLWKRSRKSSKGEGQRTRSAEVLWLIGEHEAAKPGTRGTEEINTFQ